MLINGQHVVKHSHTAYFKIIYNDMQYDYNIKHSDTRKTNGRQSMSVSRFFAPLFIILKVAFTLFVSGIFEPKTTATINSPILPPPSSQSRLVLYTEE